MKKESSLDKIDNYFAGKTDNEIKTILLVIAAVLFGFLMFLYFTPAKEFQESQNTRLQKATTDLTRATRELEDLAGGPGAPDKNYKINQHNNALRAEKARLENLKYQNTYLDQKLRENASVTYNQETWANFLDELTKTAETNNVKIVALESDSHELEFGVPQEVLDVVLTIEGKFNNVLRYINDVEQSVVVVDVKGFEITPNLDDEEKQVSGSVKVSVWGMEYR